MAGTVNNNAASIPQLINAVNSIAPQAGLNPQTLLAGITGGGGATGATGTPAAGATGTPAAGAQAPAAPQPGITARGVSVQITSEGGKPRLVAPTGMDEKVELVNAQTGAKTGQIMLFNGAGVQVRNFELVARQPIKVDLDQRVGIASGISNLSRIVAQRQERLKGLQEALAQDSNETGNTNQLDIQQLVQEQQVSENISNLNHKIYESVQNALSPWLR